MQSKNYSINELMNQFSFKKGFDQVPHGKVKQVRDELMDALGIKTRPSWLARLRGNVEPKISEAETIERIFAKYNINEVWGE